MSHDGLRMSSSTLSGRFDEIPHKRRGGRPKKVVGAARLLVDVWASVQRHKMRIDGHGSGYGLPTFEECVSEPELREYRSNEVNPRYQKGGRLVVERYVVHEDVVECCQLVESALKKVGCPDWFRAVLVETWPRRGKYAGCLLDEKGKSDWPMRKYAQRASVALELGGLRSSYVDKNLGQLLESMEAVLLDAVQDQVASRWGLE